MSRHTSVFCYFLFLCIFFFFFFFFFYFFFYFFFFRSNNYDQRRQPGIRNQTYFFGTLPFRLLFLNNQASRVAGIHLKQMWVEPAATVFIHVSPSVFCCVGGFFCGGGGGGAWGGPLLLRPLLLLLLLIGWWSFYDSILVALRKKCLNRRKFSTRSALEVSYTTYPLKHLIVAFLKRTEQLLIVCSLEY